MTQRPLRVCLDARLRDGEAGGVQQFVMGLASGLSRLRDGDEEYLFLSRPDSRAWLLPHLSGGCRTLDVVRPEWHQSFWSRAAWAPFAGARALVFQSLVHSRLGGLLRTPLADSDGAVERSGADVMHFTVQDGFRTAVPSIYQPYDLQHLHLPQFFSPYVKRWRGARYAPLSAAARAVVVMSSWVKEDVIRHFQLPPEKVRVIPWAPVTEEYPEPTVGDLARVRRELSLPDAFALYPAQTYRHKNHLGLLDAVHLARRRGVEMRVVCPGKQNEHFKQIARRAEQLELERRVVFPGYVTSLELRCLYRLARFLVFPSLFEGGGMPVFEAYAARLPVACSNVTCIPQQAGDAALLFDPADPMAIADAMIRLWTDPVLREELARRGARRVAQFSWDRTARTYRALYRQIAGRQVTREDRDLLDSAPGT